MNIRKRATGKSVTFGTAGLTALVPSKDPEGLADFNKHPFWTWVMKWAVIFLDEEFGRWMIWI